MKWYKKLAFHLLHTALLNSFMLYQKCGGKGVFLTFQHDFAAALLLDCSEVGPLKADRSEALIRLTECHFPEILQPTATWTKPQARCRVCAKNGVRRDVKTVCTSCPRKPGLCTAPCFQRWHTQVRYWD